MNYIEHYQNSLDIALSSFFQNDLDNAVNLVVRKLESKNIFLIGNGGSAALAQHFATDWTKGIHSLNKKQSKVYALTTNSSLLTAIGNDVNFDEIYSQQISMHGNSGDLLVAISSSGRSRNILHAVEVAKSINMQTLGLSGFFGGMLKDLVEVSIVVNSNDMQVIEDVHSIFGHLVYKKIANETSF